MNLTIEQLKALPIEVQEEVESTLKAYDSVNIIFEYGEYKVRTSMAILREYASDHKVIGKVKKETVFTKEQQDLNYINTFRGFPISYKGEKDWAMISKLNEYSYDDENCPKVVYDNEGNFVLA